MASLSNNISSELPRHVGGRKGTMRQNWDGTVMIRNALSARPRELSQYPAEFEKVVQVAYGDHQQKQITDSRCHQVKTVEEGDVRLARKVAAGTKDQHKAETCHTAETEGKGTQTPARNTNRGHSQDHVIVNRTPGSMHNWTVFLNAADSQENLHSNQAANKQQHVHGDNQHLCLAVVRHGCNPSF
ncbi:extracellular GDSL-like lipase, putative [Babesia ovis]|uniref:Extracellular GDSL-like lipase, putative n=1 Tax=Babesia ovis TaxID=5869 RepID=A0A9W5WUZ8_BABOV|nr:extracellular GDSL-like lipase, putative [Babesia ovis]